MSDPAIEAAQRAWSWRYGPEAPHYDSLVVDAAREALKPIRDLHKRQASWSFRLQETLHLCAECDENWPCPTARLVYSTEELES